MSSRSQVTEPVEVPGSVFQKTSRLNKSGCFLLLMLFQLSLNFICLSLVNEPYRNSGIDKVV